LEAELVAVEEELIVAVMAEEAEEVVAVRYGLLLGFYRTVLVLSKLTEQLEAMGEQVVDMTVEVGVVEVVMLYFYTYEQL
jgi:hypothetical protein